MELISKLNQTIVLLKFEDLEEGKAYPILHAEKTNSRKYGNEQLKLRIRLEDDAVGVIYLPARFCKAVNSDNIHQLQTMAIVYKGPEPIGDAKFIHDLRFVKIVD